MPDVLVLHHDVTTTARATRHSPGRHLLPRGVNYRTRHLHSGRYQAVRASPQEADPALLQPFIDAGLALVANGASALRRAGKEVTVLHRLLLLNDPHAGVVTVAASLAADTASRARADCLEGITAGTALQGPC